MSKTILIIGAHGGLGRVVAETLAGAGHQVFAAMRDPTGRNRERANALWAQAIDVVAVDPTDDGSIDRCVEAVRAKAGRIDVLITNPGESAIGVCEAFTADQALALFEANVIGLLRTLRAVLPTMRAASEGLVINIGSIIGRVGFPFLGLHGASMAAIDALTDAVREETAPFGVETVLIQCGVGRIAVTDTARRPDDAARLSSYGARGQVPVALGERFTAVSPEDEARDARAVASTVAALVDAARGRRPGRVVVGADAGADVLERLMRAARSLVLEDLGLAPARPTSGPDRIDA